MTTWLIAVVQGVTEFIPVSSSGHLVLLRELIEVRENDVVIDVAAHVGTLLAGLIYFRKTVWEIFCGLLDVLHRRASSNANLTLNLILGTLPLVVVGGVLSATGWYRDYFRTTQVLAIANIVFASFLYLSNRVPDNDKSDLGTMPVSHALAIGFAQILAFIPGASRSGVAMTAARFLGYRWVDAAKFSLLLGMPAIVAAAAGQSIDVLARGVPDGLLGDVLGTIVISFAAALVSLPILFWVLKRIGIVPFVAYRLGFGLLLIAVI